LSSSLPHGAEEPIEYSTDPELIFEKYEHEVDLVIDGGLGGLIPSTVLDCTGDEVVCLREGLGDFQGLL
jgi:tRNA A37 threonylcarbamoyladenosine synthetase subunit TsaC/SUA5/YrdC